MVILRFPDLWDNASKWQDLHTHQHSITCQRNKIKNCDARSLPIKDGWRLTLIVGDLVWQKPYFTIWIYIALFHFVLLQRESHEPIQYVASSCLSVLSSLGKMDTATEVLCHTQTSDVVSNFLCANTVFHSWGIYTHSSPCSHQATDFFFH